ncbi:MAG: hypothetical protein M2R45_03369 [Verrucomicrobia subdivision 3 bacterium]|nr:hypothetical protein [Limisphaerales bacterium]MCS1416718.1 hypothetical protein [Limisphaerales bacterium]
MMSDGRPDGKRRRIIGFAAVAVLAPLLAGVKGHEWSGSAVVVAQSMRDCGELLMDEFLAACENFEEGAA